MSYIKSDPSKAENAAILLPSNSGSSYGSINTIKEPEPSLSTASTCCPIRYVVIATAFCANCLAYIMRSNLSVAIVRMVNSSIAENTTEHMSRSCDVWDYNQSEISNATLTIDDDHEQMGEFDWSEKTQGMVLSSFVFTFAFGGLAGGRLGDVLGAKRILGWGVGLLSILCLLTPLAAYGSVYLLVIVRLLEGFLAGMAMPTMNTIVSRWMPKSERSIGCSLLLGATRFGNVLGLLLTGLLCKSTVLNGWPLTFYVFGAAGVLWAVAWWLVMYETPIDHPRISKKELDYILLNQGQEKTRKRASLPYRQVFSSVPVWATVFANIGESWGMATIPITLPLYLSHILHFDVEMAGLFAALPSLFQALFMWISGFLSDYLLSKEFTSRTTMRKVMNSIGQIAAALALVGATMVGCDRVANVVLFTLALGLNGFVAAGFRPSVVDMAPDFAGSIMGFSVFIANIVGFISPYIAGILTNKQQTLFRWHMVFWINAGFYLFGGICFLIGGSSELQPWGLAKPEEIIPEDQEVLERQEDEVY